MRAELMSGHHRHRRVDAVFSGCIVGRGDDTSLSRIPAAADDDRFPDEVGISLLFDGGEKGVHVDVNYSSFADNIFCCHISTAAIISSGSTYTRDSG